VAFIVAFASQKGGVAKSTLSQALAVGLIESGITVKIADYDFRQHTSTDWAADRLGDPKKAVVPVQTYRTLADVLRERELYEVLIIDAPGHSGEHMLTLARAADLLVQPSGGSLADLRPAIREFNELVRQGIPKDKLTLILSRIRKETEEEAAKLYIQDAGYSLIDGALRDKLAYAMAMDKGAAVTEVSGKKMKEEAKAATTALVDAILSRIGGAA
jgi:chromosome partitioning protein